MSALGERTKEAEDGNEIQEGADQYAEARSAPGVVAPGAYSAAWAQQQSLRRTGGRWTDETALPYNSDDPRYRDNPSNSSGGAGQVSGRITGLAADDSGYVYAGAANGGVWRSRTGGGTWEPISDKLPSPATGDLQLDGKGRLWYATGEANTSSTAFVGSGVYVLADPKKGQFQPGTRVGGTELESTIIRALRFGGDKVWAATNRGVWSHSTTTLSGPWTLEFAPNPSYLPGGANAKEPSAPYKNIANDIAIDPKDPSKVVLAIGWRSGDTYNGFYAKQGEAWQRVPLPGDIASDPATVGAVTFAAAADGSRFYAIEQSPSMDPALATGLYGVFVSESGSPFSTWTRIADSKKLAASGSGIADLPGYQPGIQAWYNQFLQVDPTDPNHLYLGLEEVFETVDGGKTWTTPGPYWNFFFPCWSPDPSKQTGDCHQTTHPDQHSVAVGKYQGKAYVIVGNDGGAYRRPLRGQADAAGHATDWTSLNDGTMDVLQYYSVGVGRDPGVKNNDYGRGRSLKVAISGGLQDNGQSIKRSGDKVMGSNFGGDGGDTIVDPRNGCNIAEEYVYLAMQVTNDCAANAGMWDPETATSRDIAPPDNKLGPDGARFIAPFTFDAKDSNVWVAGGRHVWVQDKGWNIQSGSDWTSVFDLGATVIGKDPATGKDILSPHVATAVAVSDGMAYVGWCGPCNNQGFTRGIAVGKVNDPASWRQLDLPAEGQLPNRYVSGFDVDPDSPNHVFVAINGFSRRWTEGPGAGIGHVFESRNAGKTWTDISGNMPDVPAGTVKMVRGGGLVVGTDLGVFYRAPRGKEWTALGQNLPTTTTMQLKTGPDGKLYTATHGRGIWSYDLSQLRAD
ncbi:glycosyl hydrolase [Planosporangium flavigriseum]|uniref:glycosyl hydrolase n=1 Tax=Planosporangium flavigriseum TaxID=373681 RepID=UPI001EF3C346|nr:glycosyl hydrolase [Planosporangium flavigriseum]